MPVLIPSIGIVIKERKACTTVATVIQKSPAALPVFCRTAFRTMIITLSVAMMRKGDTPSNRVFSMIFALYPPRESRTFVRLESRTQSTNIIDIACESMVASAAPFMPIPQVNMNIGSRITFATAPIEVVSIPSPE